MPYRNRLAVVRIGERCRESWERMEGDDCVRFCATCRKHVYSVRERSFEEMKPILELHEGQGPIPLAARADGTLMNSDGMSCSEARRGRRRRSASRLLVQGAAAVLVTAAFVALGTLASPVTPAGEKRGAIPPLVEVIGGSRPQLPDYVQTRIRARFVTRRSTGAERGGSVHPVP